MKPIAVSMGEPAGIGPEIILKAWAAREREQLPPFFVCGDIHGFLGAIPLGNDTVVELAFVALDEVKAASGPLHANAIPMLSFPVTGTVRPGTPDSANGKAVIAALEAATNACIEGHASALVTAPIQKSTLYEAGFKYPGHTEYLEARFAGDAKAPESLMLLVGGGLKVALVTIHLPLKDVAAAITQEKIVRKGLILAEGLKRDFGIANPRIAVSALNPHGGEGGALGREEIDIIAPAVAQLAAKGVNATGPHPTDTLFHEGAREKYDAALCMYHDQALIPLKTLDFYSGVNVTLGLPIVRTSPDHGTALDIAGKGMANPASFIAALKLAADIARRRGTA